MKEVILASGQGTPLATYTTVLPKPLLPVVGGAILETILRQLQRRGVSEVLIACVYLGSLVRAYLDPHEISQHLKITYLQETNPWARPGRWPI